MTASARALPCLTKRRLGFALVAMQGNSARTPETKSSGLSFFHKTDDYVSRELEDSIDDNPSPPQGGAAGWLAVQSGCAEWRGSKRRIKMVALRIRCFSSAAKFRRRANPLPPLMPSKPQPFDDSAFEVVRSLPCQQAPRMSPSFP